MITIAQEAADRMLEWFDSKITRFGGFFNASISIEELLCVR
jgi:hypothetical protein